jgi:hypothetical protein
VLNRTNDNLVAEYRYNGLGFRITEHVDTDTDGDVDGNDAEYHFVYDDSWRIVATYVDDDDAADAKELFVHHAAGDGGYGGSSYIDAVIMRDVDLSTDWDAEADALDTRHYYCQNWRADVSVIIDDSAVIVERVMYSPYGVPFGIPLGDLATTGTNQEPADGTVDAADLTLLVNNYSGSWNFCDIDNDGDVDMDDGTLLGGNGGTTLGWGALSDYHNRFGYAGYVFDEALAGTKWHVRHRVLESGLGRWVSRDSANGDRSSSLYNANLNLRWPWDGSLSPLGDGVPPMDSDAIPIVVWGGYVLVAAFVTAVAGTAIIVNNSGYQQNAPRLCLPCVNGICDHLSLNAELLLEEMEYLMRQAVVQTVPRIAWTIPRTVPKLDRKKDRQIWKCTIKPRHSCPPQCQHRWIGTGTRAKAEAEARAKCYAAGCHRPPCGCGHLHCWVIKF